MRFFGLNYVYGDKLDDRPLDPSHILSVINNNLYLALKHCTYSRIDILDIIRRYIIYFKSRTCQGIVQIYR